jgi:hypothetical protein
LNKAQNAERTVRNKRAVLVREQAKDNENDSRRREYPAAGLCPALD